LTGVVPGARIGLHNVRLMATQPTPSDPRPQLFAVLGNPVAHSLSPSIHALFAAQFGFGLEYRRIRAEAGRFAQAVADLRAAGARGANVTLPFKQEAWELCDEVSDRADAASAVNTLVFRRDGTVWGDNTDGFGLVRDLTVNQRCEIAGRRVLVVGAGGAARGVLQPLLSCLPAGLVLANRTRDRAVEIAHEFRYFGPIDACGLAELRGLRFDLVINGTSASLTGDLPELPDGLFLPSALAYDMMYADRPTPFLRWAGAHGAARTADGLGMLVEQAAESFFVWHDRRPSTALVMAALRAGASDETRGQRDA
jgi:shikimate dehydrogenase